MLEIAMAMGTRVLHPKNIQNTPRKGHTALFLWASGIQRLGPFAALIKPLF